MISSICYYNNESKRNRYFNFKEINISDLKYLIKKHRKIKMTQIIYS